MYNWGPQWHTVHVCNHDSSPITHYKLETAITELVFFPGNSKWHGAYVSIFLFQRLVTKSPPPHFKYFPRIIEVHTSKNDQQGSDAKLILADFNGY